MRLSDISRKSVKIRLQYLSLIAHMARIDGKFDEQEIELLKKMVKRFRIPQKHENTIFAEQEISDQKIQEIFDELQKNQLQHSFMLDLITMAIADGIILEPERLMLVKISRLVGLKHEEFHNLINFAQATSNLSDDDHNDPMYQYVIEMFFKWARQKDVKLFSQTTFAINDTIDRKLKTDL